MLAHIVLVLKQYFLSRNSFINYDPVLYHQYSEEELTKSQWFLNFKITEEIMLLELLLV